MKSNIWYNMKITKIEKRIDLKTLKPEFDITIRLNPTTILDDISALGEEQAALKFYKDCLAAYKEYNNTI